MSGVLVVQRSPHCQSRENQNIENHGSSGVSVLALKEIHQS